ncbi:MAG TPA: SGNH/GDSL hydrolase family protein [Polyangiaceae bacterium]
MAYENEAIGQFSREVRFRMHRLLHCAPVAIGFVAASACSNPSSESSNPANAESTGGATLTGSGGSALNTRSSVTPSSGGTHVGVGGTSNPGSVASGGTQSSSAMASGGTQSSSTTASGGAVNAGGSRATGGTTAFGGTTAKTNTVLAAGGTGGLIATGGNAVTAGSKGTATASGGVGSGGLPGGGTGGKAVGGSSSSVAGASNTSTGFMPCPTTAGTACNVMPVGDSITEGCCTAPMGGYRIELFRQALSNKKNLTFVGTLTNGPANVDGKTFPQHHEGHGGWKISQIAGVIDNAIKSSSPHIVLLKIGTNDINGNDDIANAPNRLASLIDQITKDAPAALLVVSAIVPTRTDGTNTKVQAYNTAIKAKADAAAATGKHVVFVDNYQAFAENSNYRTAWMADNLHPNDAGYVVLGKSFYGVISQLLPSAQ